MHKSEILKFPSSISGVTLDREGDDIDVRVTLEDGTVLYFNVIAPPWEGSPMAENILLALQSEVHRSASRGYTVVTTATLSEGCRVGVGTETVRCVRVTLETVGGAQ